MNSSAWDKFRKQQSTEREELQRLLSGIHPLLTKCRTTVPTEMGWTESQCGETPGIVNSC